jgi:hypothetical protein
MKINRNNYEAYFLDYIEGRLDEDSKEELAEFLQQNPSIKTELDTFENISLFPNNPEFPAKSDLYKLEFEKTTINHLNYGDYCIAYHENILTEEKKQECTHFSNLNYKNKEELIRSGKVYLVTDLNIICPNKKVLYHKAYTIKRTVIRMAATCLTVAASVIIGLFIHNTMNNTKPQNQFKVTKTERVKTKLPPINLAIANPKINIKPMKTTIRTTKRDKIKTEVRNIPILSHSVDSSLSPVLIVEQKLMATQLKNKGLDLTKILAQNTVTPSEEKDTSSINENKESTNTRKNSLLALAETGITKINQLTGTNIELSHQTNESGKIKVLSIKTGIFGYYHKRSR